MFPAAAARKRLGWNHVPLIDLHQMEVAGSLTNCIRILIQVNTPIAQSEIIHRYLRQAQALRPDLDVQLYSWIYLRSIRLFSPISRQ